ncbi:MAG: hypothetical protein M1831_002342 [Alyxoria varia]|nr:MAG: hypothetical protein M1831_002342 [Alyxoria varia]
MNLSKGRPLSRIRFNFTPNPWHRPARIRVPELRPRCFTTTRPSQGILGLDRKDLRTEKSEKAHQVALRKGKVAQQNEEAPSHRHRIKVYSAPRSVRDKCPDPIRHLSSLQLGALDPTGSRARLFDRTNPECARVGDILLVRTRSGDPFSGLCLNIKRRGVDTSILLRNQLTRVGVEMQYKIYSPNVTGVEVVQRRAKRARRARLYYYRLPKHDLGSVEGVVRRYVRMRAALRRGEVDTGDGPGAARGRDANAGKRSRQKSK